jgi:hypothetical protein
MSRVFARETAARVALDGMRWCVGADGVPAPERPAFEKELRSSEISAAQSGMIQDMDHVADVLYERTP